MKSSLRDTAWATAGLLGISHLARWLSRNSARILMYHAVIENDAPLTRWTHMPLRSFEWQMRYLKRNYRVRPLSEVVSTMRSGQQVPSNTAVVTFDDGYESVFRRAFPVLQRLAIPASVFLTTEFIDTRELLWTSRLFLALRASRHTRLSLRDLRTQEADLDGLDVSELPLDSVAARDAATDKLRPWLKYLSDGRRLAMLAALEDLLGVEQYPAYAQEFAPLTWQQVEEMRSSDLVEFGAHSQTHPILTRLSAPQLQEEVVGSCEAVRTHCGSADLHFAYPNGGRKDFNEEIKGIVRSAGADCALSTIEGLCRTGDDLFELRRFGIGSDMTNARFAAVCSGLESALKRRMGRL